MRICGWCHQSSACVKTRSRTHLRKHKSERARLERNVQSVELLLCGPCVVLAFLCDFAEQIHVLSNCSIMVPVMTSNECGLRGVPFFRFDLGTNGGFVSTMLSTAMNLIPITLPSARALPLAGLSSQCLSYACETAAASSPRVLCQASDRLGNAVLALAAVALTGCGVQPPF